VNYDDILTVDKNAIFLAARILAYGKDYEAEITCPACGEKHKTMIDIADFDEKEVSWEHFTKGQSTFEFTLPAAGKNKVTLKLLAHGDEKKIEETNKASKKVSKITGVDTELSTRLKHAIVAVDGNTDRLFINKFVDNMLAVNSLALRKFLREVTPDVNMTFEYSCSSCGHVEEGVQLPIGVNFFWPGA
jgi:predicted RNA-binding Zn-ribbon protein involved in translation (DUF1610 family)